MTMPAVDVNEYIDSMALPELPDGGQQYLVAPSSQQYLLPSPVGDEPAPGASVAGPTLMSFTASVSPLHRDDLKFSLGLSQLSAQAQGFDVRTNPVGFYEKVVTILNNIGYVAQGVNFADFNVHTGTLQMERVVLDIMAQLVSGEELGVVRATLTALKTSAENGSQPWTIFRRHTTNDQNGSFLVGLASETSGDLAMRMGAFHFDSNTTTTQFLWWTYSGTDVNIKQGQTTMTQNETLYKLLREKVATKMGGHSLGYIDDLPLPPI